MMDKTESIRIHEEWWGKCRTCAFWGGTDAGTGDGTMGNQARWLPGPCNNPKSDMHGKITWTGGHCKKWDSFDIDTAFEIMATNEALRK